MGGLMGPMAFDAAAQKAKRDIQDALGFSQRVRPMGPPPNQQPMNIPGRPQLTPQGIALSGQQQVGPGMLSGGAMMGPQGFQGGGANYNMPVAGGQFDVGAQYRPGAGVSAGVQYRRPFQEGGLATSLSTDPDRRERDVDFINTRNIHMQNMVSLPRPFAKGGLAMAEGGAWTRKEGKNPEGGLNAKGRASLRAQGHDIKPPVSAKQAKKSPKAAARRRSFCARMSGMPGPMKDEKGRPTRKALSLRKWDC